MRVETIMLKAMSETTKFVMVFYARDFGKWYLSNKFFMNTINVSYNN